VAKELGVCLTSLKKLCRSYGITRWPFRKLKSLERTMKKVQTENSDVSVKEEGGEEKGSGKANEVKRKPYTVGSKTVFLSDEELEVFKMTMGKDATNDLKPTPISTLEPSLFNALAPSSAAASSALRANGGAALSDVGLATGMYHEGEGQCYDEDCTLKAEVKGSALVIDHWSTLWSQPQLKGKLLYPLKGASLHVTSDGVTATLTFRDGETADRALRICRLAELHAHKETDATSGHMCERRSLLQEQPLSANGALQGGDVAETSPPLSGSGGFGGLGRQDSLSGMAMPASSRDAAGGMWSSFLHAEHSREGLDAPRTNGSARAGGGRGAVEVKVEPGTGGPGSNQLLASLGGGPRSSGLGMLGDALMSPPLSGNGVLLMDGSTAPISMGSMGAVSMGAPLSTFQAFANIFQHDAKAPAGAVANPGSTDSLSAFLARDENPRAPPSSARPKEPESGAAKPPAEALPPASASGPPRGGRPSPNKQQRTADVSDVGAAREAEAGASAGAAAEAPGGSASKAGPPAQPESNLVSAQAQAAADPLRPGPRPQRQPHAPAQEISAPAQPRAQPLAPAAPTSTKAQQQQPAVPAAAGASPGKAPAAAGNAAGAGAAGERDGRTAAAAAAAAGGRRSGRRAQTPGKSDGGEDSAAGGAGLLGLLGAAAPKPQAKVAPPARPPSARRRAQGAEGAA
jgi:hypothetical protein